MVVASVFFGGRTLMNWLNWVRWILWLFLAAFIGFWIIWALTPGTDSKFGKIPLGEPVTIDGRHLYWVQRNAEASETQAPVLILPGPPFCAESFISFLEPFWNQRRIMIVDLPELGDAEKQGRAYSPETGAYLVKFLIDRFELKKVELLGYGSGAGVALVFASLFPNHVDKVALLTPPWSGVELGLLNNWKLWPVLGEIWAFTDIYQTWLKHWLGKSWVSSQRSWKEVIGQYSRPSNSFGGRMGLLAVWRGNDQFDYLPFLEKIKVPLLILQSQHTFDGPRKIKMYLSIKHQDVSIKQFPQAGTFLPSESPHEVNLALKDFLNLGPDNAAPEIAQPQEPRNETMLTSVNQKAKPVKMKLKRITKAIPEAQPTPAAPVSSSAQTQIEKVSRVEPVLQTENVVFTVTPSNELAHPEARPPSVSDETAGSAQPTPLSTPVSNTGGGLKP
jgi:pimeloyl-ACP methyl ester carboxylesterase